MQIIPVQAIPNQTLTVTLAGQQVQIDLRTMRAVSFGYGSPPSGMLVANIFLNNVALLYGVRCLDRVRLIRNAYFGFIGDLGFVDTQGQQAPVYTGLGTRYLLFYLEAADIAGAANV